MMTRSALILTLAAALTAAGPVVAQDTACPGRLAATGEGEARAVPDRMHASFTVEVEAEGPDAAFSQASEQVSAVLEALKGAGLAERDIATTSISLYPVRERPGREGAPEITGWRAGSTLRVTLDDPARFGAVADAATGAGATGIGGVGLEVSDPDPLREEARAKAVRDAMEKARGMADAAGLRLGAVLELSEAGAQDMPRPEFARAALASADMPVAPGEQTVRAEVRLVMELCEAE